MTEPTLETLSPPPFNVLDGFAFPKRCRCCGLQLSAVDWAALPFLGVQSFSLPDEPHEDDPRPLELRNCMCGSTLGIEVLP